MKAITGADIQPGMTVSLKPSAQAFTVAWIEHDEAYPRLVYLHDGTTRPVLSGTHLDQWYAVVES